MLAMRLQEGANVIGDYALGKGVKLGKIALIFQEANS